MHTDPKDPNGQDLTAIMNNLGLVNGEVYLSTQKVPPEQMALYYNMADCTINISDAEGFGLATLESLSCGTPIIVNMTGGLQEQVISGAEMFGVPLLPSSKAIIGSQDVPYIYEDYVSNETIANSIYKLYSLSPEEKEALSKKVKEYTDFEFKMEDTINDWDETLNECIQSFKQGKYKFWNCEEL